MCSMRLASFKSKMGFERQYEYHDEQGISSREQFECRMNKRGPIHSGEHDGDEECAN